MIAEQCVRSHVSRLHVRHENASLKHLPQFILQSLIDEAEQLVAVHRAVPQPACPDHPASVTPASVAQGLPPFKSACLSASACIAHRSCPVTALQMLTFGAQ